MFLMANPLEILIPEKTSRRNGVIEEFVSERKDLKSKRIETRIKKRKIKYCRVEFFPTLMVEETREARRMMVLYLDPMK
jgi:hypothetical protein